MIDAEHHERGAVRGALAVLARARSHREFIGADRVFGSEIARPQTVYTPKQSRHLIGGDPRKTRFTLQCLVERRPDIAAHRVVARHRFVCALEHDDVLLAGERLYDRRLREWSEHVDVDRSDSDPALL